MEPLIALTAVTLIGLALRRPWSASLRAGVTAMFLLTGVVHFVGMRQELIDMVPPALPAPGLLVTLTGILELAGAVALWSDRLRLPAAGGLTLLLLAMFPANVHHALNHEVPWAEELGPRSVLQVVFLAATGWLTWDELRRRRSTPADADADADPRRALTDARL